MDFLQKALLVQRQFKREWLLVFLKLTDEFIMMIIILAINLKCFLEGIVKQSIHFHSQEFNQRCYLQSELETAVQRKRFPPMP